MNKNLKNRIKAFSLAEMMIVMLVVSILTAAMMPILTRYIQNSSKVVNDPIWATSATDSSDIYFKNFGTPGAQVLIGETSESNVNSNLVINSSDTTPQMLILASGTPHFELGMSTNGILFGFSDVVSGGGLSIGSGASATGQSSVATTGGTANGVNSVAIGLGSSANGDNAVAIGGSGTIKASDNKRYVYDSGKTSADVAGAAASSNNSVAIGTGSVAAENSTAIGEVSNALGTYSVALGTAAFARGGNSVAISNGYTAPFETGSNSVLIGHSAFESHNDTIVIGDCTGTVSISGHNTYMCVSDLDKKYQINLDAQYIGLGGLYGSSDRRLKNVKGPFTAGLESIDKIQPYNYTFKKDKQKIPYVGVMAQDLQKVFPNAVTKIDKKGHLGIRQDDMFYCMINSVKQLYASFKSVLVKLYGIEKGLNVCAKTEEINPKLINELEQQNNALSIKNKQLKRRLALLEKKVK